jgi:hypothetical protein
MDRKTSLLCIAISFMMVMCVGVASTHHKTVSQQKCEAENGKFTGNKTADEKDWECIKLPNN